MSTLVIDITPLAINRTAMYFIVRDTVRQIILSGHAVKLQALGEPIDLAEFIANDFALHAGVDAKVSARLAQALENPAAFASSQAPSSRSHDVNFVFDPLYLLFVKPATRTIAYVLDLTPISRPQWHNSRVSQLYATAFARLYDPTIDIISISESTSRDLWANYGIPRSRVRVVPLYDRFAQSAEPPPRQPSRQFLFVGSLEVRKNIAGLAEGFALSGLARRGYKLHIVGGDGHGSDLIKASVSQVPGAVLRGRLSDSDLRAEYESCCCLAYPSLWEGFGLPALEALARDIPLLLADTGALPEVGGPFATYVDPCNPRSIADGLIAVAKQTENHPSNADDLSLTKRKEWLAKFTRDAYLEVITDVIEHVRGLDNTKSASGSDHLSNIASPVGDDTPLVGTRSGRIALRRRIRAFLIHRSRIVPATIQDVPGNSFSLDYLYCLQQERRLRMSRILSRFMSGRVWLFPWYTVRIVTETISLQLTNALIKSMVNEIVIQKLSTRLEQPRD